MLRFVVALVLSASLPIVGCGVARRHGAGVDCELSSECDAPLVCRLDRCRNECATSGDCPDGLACVLDAEGLGSCQTAGERDCALSSACPVPLVCHLRQCVNECAADRDCLGGARCEISAEGGACIDVSTMSCVVDGECRAVSPELYCLAGRCRELCATDRDCRRGLVCSRVLGGCVPSSDGGALDGGALDGGLDSGSVDSGGLDGSTGDTALDADLDAAALDASTDASSTDGGPTTSLLVRVVRSGYVTIAPGGTMCTSPTFDFTPWDCTYPAFGGPVVLTARPDMAFGFSQVHWSGDCEPITPPGFDCRIASGAGFARACFHTGDPTSCIP